MKALALEQENERIECTFSPQRFFSDRKQKRRIDMLTGKGLETELRLMNYKQFRDKRLKESLIRAQENEVKECKAKPQVNPKSTIIVKNRLKSCGDYLRMVKPNDRSF